MQPFRENGAAETDFLEGGAKVEGAPSLFELGFDSLSFDWSPAFLS